MNGRRKKLNRNGWICNSLVIVFGLLNKHSLENGKKMDVEVVSEENALCRTITSIYGGDMEMGS